ncbi:hypothetical protein B0H16DRAFT_1640744 [Mycena metata]|uniref:Uncharacterized protein n=1 Tax=Mycena metata TaxID=1033252 RepID=A0AAD7DY01_9AGAR|nr:hypothetical protein B0H16DRAFT_1640744 [Mycena metata]
MATPASIPVPDCWRVLVLTFALVYSRTIRTRSCRIASAFSLRSPSPTPKPRRSRLPNPPGWRRRITTEVPKGCRDTGRAPPYARRTGTKMHRRCALGVRSMCIPPLRTSTSSASASFVPLPRCRFPRRHFRASASRMGGGRGYPRVQSALVICTQSRNSAPRRWPVATRVSVPRRGFPMGMRGYDCHALDSLCTALTSHAVETPQGHPLPVRSLGDALLLLALEHFRRRVEGDAGGGGAAKTRRHPRPRAVATKSVVRTIRGRGGHRTVHVRGEEAERSEEGDEGEMR